MQNQKSPPELPNSWRTAATQRRLSVDTLLSLLLVGVLQGVQQVEPQLRPRLELARQAPQGVVGKGHLHTTVRRQPAAAGKAPVSRRRG